MCALMQQPGRDFHKLFVGNWSFSISANNTEFLAACQGLHDEVVLLDGAYIGVESFKLVANTRQVVIHRLQLDMVGNVDYIEAEGVWCWFRGEVMVAAESYVGFKGRGVSLGSAGFNGTTYRDGMLMAQLLHGPRLPGGLPGLFPARSHFCTAPIIKGGG